MAADSGLASYRRLRRCILSLWTYSVVAGVLAVGGGYLLGWLAGQVDRNGGMVLRHVATLVGIVLAGLHFQSLNQRLRAHLPPVVPLARMAVLAEPVIHQRTRG
jgi:hypothetical protein